MKDLTVVVKSALLADFEEGKDYPVYWDEEQIAYIKTTCYDMEEEEEYEVRWTLQDLAYNHVRFELR